MPQGLQLKIGADVTEATAALKQVTTEAKATGVSVNKSFSKSTLPLTKGVKELSQTVKTVTPQISTLGNSIETLRAKALARKSFLITETDIVKIKQYNREIKLLEAEIVRLQAVGTGGVGITGAATKGFSALRNIAHILPGVGIAGIFSGLFNALGGIGSKADETAKKLKELIVPVEDIRRAAGAGVEEELSKVSALSNAVLNQSLSYKERNNALNQLKEINKGYFGDLTVETAALGLLKTRVNEYTEAIINAAVIKAFSDQIGKINVELQAQEKTFNDLGKVIKEQNDQVLINQKLIATGDNAAKQQTDGLIQRVAIATGKFNDQGKVVGKLRNQMFELRTAIQEAVNTSLSFKPLDTKDLKTSVEKLKEFVRNRGSEADLLIPVKIILDFSAGSASESFSKQVKPVSDELQKLVESTTKNNPILLLAHANLQIGIEADKQLKNVLDNINKTIQATAVNAFAGLGETLGAALVGGDLKQGFAAFANIIADGFSAIGKQMIAAAPIIAALKAAIKSLNPAILLPAGLALVAIGAALRGSIGKGITGFEGGGLVSGPTLGLIGEGAGTSRSNPEVIAPLDKLKAMLADLNIGNQNIRVLVSGRLRGRDMALQNARTSRSQRRLGA